MRRGSTPTHKFCVDMDLREATVFITYSQNNKVIVEKTGEDIEVTENTLTVRLTQEDTLAFEVGMAEVQARYVFPNGAADASTVIKITIEKTLKAGVI